ncbi:immobilization antigen (macronuclear) [Tetrahymena thermophila SB210]|uniref:Immobilization antigen n=1 Tax=Tetrahymena thermophila (strain SB210) TaxID=312017 RepID=Q24DP6_TETTS|nr:immobilization antigen [Tetrahymena thermophila SB210]EAS05944.1 immobilization antigen [Tetrahymena thermophila SB210]|eukprot:XP_001026189.1 immobilization antigen [Tetrahymena thermophila SB210]
MINKSLIFAFLILSFISCCSQNQVEVTIKTKVCLCSAGYYGDTTAGDCQKCPQGTTSLPPDSKQLNLDVSFCSQCQINYYMNQQAVQPKGRLLQTAAICLQCPQGTGNNSGPTTKGDQSQCNVCLPGYYMTGYPQPNQPAQCTPCPSNSTNRGVNIIGDVSQCDYCKDNFYLTATAQPGKNPQSAQCSPCPANSYSSASNTQGFCTCFDSNANPLSGSQTSCACQSGYAGTVATSKSVPSGCQKCGNNQFISGNTCVTCADGSTANKDFSGCTCNDTSDGTSAWSSQNNVCQCKQNYYGTPDKASQGSTGSCKQCPQGTTSVAGSKTSDLCLKPPKDNSSISQSNSLIISFYIIINLIFIALY